MKIVHSWLKEFIKINLTCDQLAEKLNLLGMEVEGVEKIGADFSGVYCGQILKIEKHPNADKLSLVTLETRKGKAKIVCGATNLKLNNKVPVAEIGAKLTTTNGLEKAKIRGIESCGMICSADELGIVKERQEGIVVLDKNVKVGANVKSLYGKADYVYEVEIPPNRPDLLSHLGVARELGVLLNLPVKKPAIKKIKTSGNGLDISISAKDGCYRYMGAVVKGVKNVQSPDWLKQRLTAIDMTPKTALIDITNYVLHELGNPLHAFDLRNIDKKINVRFAKTNEKLKTLDGEILKLNKNSLLVADAKKPLVLAGIIGGENSGVKEDTFDIFLEGAFFNPVVINKTARGFGISTDSSYRFERGVDLDGVEYAFKRALNLITEICGGNVSKIKDVYPTKQKNSIVNFKTEDINNILGSNLGDKQIKTIFKNLGESFGGNSKKWKFLAPSWRRDLNHKWDLAEEAARFAGYDEIKNSTNLAHVSYKELLKEDVLINKITEKLTSLSFYECKNFDFVSSKDLAIFNHKETNSVKLKNPLNEDWQYLRPTLLNGLIKNISLNQRHGNLNLSLFEVGKTYELKKGFPKETWVVSGALCGDINNKFFNEKAKKADFFYLKGAVENLVSNFGNVKLEQKKDLNFMHPEICADIFVNGKSIGFFGKLHPLIADKFELKDKNIWVFELALEEGFKTLESSERVVLKPIGIYPGSSRDISLIVNSDVKFTDIEKVINANKIIENTSFNLIDLYEGEKLGKDKKSITIRLNFSLSDRTLKDREVSDAVDKIVDNLKTKLSATQR
ncbi:MAG: phenylalanine--tRNA ligase subunit beta [Elusimicrobiaceae bacterium]|nr:phenylalanine--tRNA ligase subunit beta [Elusimicrobiaceae bacterium]